MENKAEFNTDFDKKSFNAENVEPIYKQTSNKTLFPKIAGIILIIAGLLAVLNWAQIFTYDASTLESFIDISQIQEIYPQITYQQLNNLLQTCAIIGIIISLFPILGGLFAIQKKLYYIAITGSIIGLFSMGFIFTSSILSLIGLILLIMARQEFK